MATYIKYKAADLLWLQENAAVDSYLDNTREAWEYHLLTLSKLVDSEEEDFYLEDPGDGRYYIEIWRVPEECNEEEETYEIVLFTALEETKNTIMHLAKDPIEPWHLKAAREEMELLEAYEYDDESCMDGDEVIGHRE